MKMQLSEPLLPPVAALKNLHAVKTRNVNDAGKFRCTRKAVFPLFSARLITKHGMNVESDADDSLEEIYTWIERITFSRPKKNIARDFSDGVFMAELLKRYYPRYVDVHNYIPGNSIAKKVDNWSTLNRKVLAKLDIKLGKEVIRQLANSQPGVIEKVLTELRAKILKDCNADRDSLHFDGNENGKDVEIAESVLNPEEIANKTVPRRAFVRLKQLLEEKNEVINTLHQKVSHLESLMKLKDERINDLTAQITRSKERVATPRPKVLEGGFSNSRGKM